MELLQLSHASGSFELHEKRPFSHENGSHSEWGKQVTEMLLKPTKIMWSASPSVKQWKVDQVFTKQSYMMHANSMWQELLCPCPEPVAEEQHSAEAEPKEPAVPPSGHSAPLMARVPHAHTANCPFPGFPPSPLGTFPPKHVQPKQAHLETGWYF